MQKKPVRKKRAARKVSRTPEKSDDTPVGYMLKIMRDPKASPQRRDAMAKSATPYIHVKPAAKKKSVNGESSLKRRLETARATLASKIAKLRSEGD